MNAVPDLHPNLHSWDKGRKHYKKQSKITNKLNIGSVRQLRRAIGTSYDQWCVQENRLGKLQTASSAVVAQQIKVTDRPGKTTDTRRNVTTTKFCEETKSIEWLLFLIILSRPPHPALHFFFCLPHNSNFWLSKTRLLSDVIGFYSKFLFKCLFFIFFYLSSFFCSCFVCYMFFCCL